MEDLMVYPEGANRAGQPRVVAVVGAGYWATNMLRVIGSSDSCELRTICDTDEARAHEAAATYGARATTDVIDITNDPEIEAVYIATPPGTHAELALQMLRAGKHVLVEKPLTTSATDAELLVQQATSSEVTLMVGHTFLYSPPVMKVRDLLTDGTLGDCLYMDSQRVNLGKFQNSGVMWDLAPHDLSIALYWLGNLPTQVLASARSFRSSDREDVAFLTLDFPDGAVVHLHVSWLAPVKLRRTTLSCSNRMVVYDDTAGQEAVKVYDQGVDVRSPETFGEFQLTYRQGDIWVPRLDNSEPLRTEWEHFLDCCSTGKPSHSDGAQGLAVVKILEAADKSLRTNQRVGLEWERSVSTKHRPRFGVAAPEVQSVRTF